MTVVELMTLLEEAGVSADDLTSEDIEDILRLARDRAELMRALKAAVVEGNVLKVMEAARKACGLDEETKQ